MVKLSRTGYSLPPVKILVPDLLFAHERYQDVAERVADDCR